jgi:hypothetical protein
MAERASNRDALSRLRELLESQYPCAYCDGCLAFELDLSLAEAKATARTLASEPRFGRERRDCYGCGRAIELTVKKRGKLLR